MKLSFFGYNWIWAEYAVFFTGPIMTGMRYTLLLPNCVIKLYNLHNLCFFFTNYDFFFFLCSWILKSNFYFMTDKTTNLKLSFEQCILKIPKYQLETSLYNALLNKMSPEKPLKMCWESNDILVHTICKGIMQVR